MRCPWNPLRWFRTIRQAERQKLIDRARLRADQLVDRINDLGRDDRP